MKVTASWIGGDQLLVKVTNDDPSNPVSEVRVSLNFADLDDNRPSEVLNGIRGMTTWAAD